ncbi:hypothetical protein F5887DRAFT_1249038 [Amanita rubescens]|nr:hypothetical protein F5887DRAFT_1249038 [Amanita rubescens]
MNAAVTFLYREMRHHDRAYRRITAIRRRIAAVSDESAQFSAFLAQCSMEEAQQSNAMDTEDTGLGASDGGSVHSTQAHGINAEPIMSENDPSSHPDTVGDHSVHPSSACQDSPSPLPLPQDNSPPSSVHQNDPVQTSTLPEIDEIRVTDTGTLGLDSQMSDIQIAAQFINELKNATLEHTRMDPENIEHLHSAPSHFSFDVYDPDFIFSLCTFMAVSNASQATYNDTALEQHPTDPFLSCDQVKRRIEQLSGVVPIMHDMCVDTYAAFTGPFKNLNACPICQEPRYHQGTLTPCRQFSTIPIGPVIQS